jgi:hypothetical protein
MADVTGTYYAGDAFIGYGTELRVGQGDSPETFVAIADVVSITPGDMTTPVIDKTHLRSPDRHREKLATIRDSGPFVIAGNYRPGHGSHTVAGGDGFDPARSLVSLWRDVTEANFEIELPEAATDGGSPGGVVLAFRGVVTKYQIGQIGLDTKVDFTAEITPLSAYTLP